MIGKSFLGTLDFIPYSLREVRFIEFFGLNMLDFIVNFFPNAISLWGHIDLSIRDAITYLMASISVVVICNRLKLSPVLGYLAAGVLLGPNAFGAISQVKGANFLAEFGVVFLMFTIGLQLPWERLKTLRKYVFGMGAVQVILTGFIFALIAYWMNQTIEASILIGGGLSLSSTAIILQILEDRNELSSRHGRITFSILLFQDLAVVVFLVWLSIMGQSQHETVWIAFMQAFGRATAVLIIIALLGHYVLRPLYRMVAATRSSDLFIATNLFVILISSAATSAAGLSMELGAFLAGLMLAETEYRPQIEVDIRPFRALFLGLFFMTVGMSLKPRLLIGSIAEITLLASTLMLGKAVLLILIGRIFRLPYKTCFRVGLTLAAGGEFMFVLCYQAVQSQIITSHDMQIIYMSVFVTMAMTPFLMNVGNRVASRFTREIGMALKAAEQETKDMRDHVIIAGYGRVGQTVQMMLAEQLIPHVLIDSDMARVTRGSKAGIPIFLGDARRDIVYPFLGVERARALILALGNFNAVTRVVEVVRETYPHLKIFVRVRDKEQAIKLFKMGAHPIMPETFIPSFQLVSAVFSLYGMSSEEIEKIIKKFREEYLSPKAFDKGLVPWLEENNTLLSEQHPPTIPTGED